MKRLYKGLIGALIGASTAGMWLGLDLVLPEPYGDYLLFGLMAAVNGIIGWQIFYGVPATTRNRSNVVEKNPHK
ncbi:hypothetical protein GCM10008986_13720 [Salinibacillus aidingensis]|uniref:Uncharacterized protein n=1 Tax=Salinibacillus aidingensis TaxID=237684 RepID=A0ABN1B2W8_9BACI